ncbi:hypothetical protein DPMN_063407 [Dreissena polymorpha]|uniref:Uncharacterized protein n=1 Tax=Dreissena polymorpha TaxID=45954 RepID=A0A9D4CBL8_DREPO|nr:hypothetical protein DPMN_063407 [Dreissena polymorpha]
MRPTPVDGPHLCDCVPFHLSNSTLLLERLLNKDGHDQMLNLERKMTFVAKLALDTTQKLKQSNNNMPTRNQNTLRSRMWPQRIS